jgi:hypothetical protein
MRRFLGKPKRRNITIAALGLAVAAMIAGLSVAGAAPGPSDETSRDIDASSIIASGSRITSRTPGPSGTPAPVSLPVAAELTPTPAPTPPGSDRPIAEDGGGLEEGERCYPVFLSGPMTRGTQVTIAGKTVVLPEDAELGGLVVSANPAVEADGTCPGCAALEHLPFLRIIRGNSVVSIGEKTGVVVGGRIAPGEEGTFDFLKVVFPDQADAIDSLPVIPLSETTPVRIVLGDE